MEGGGNMKKTSMVLLSILIGIAIVVAGNTLFAEDMYFSGYAEHLTSVEVYEVPDGKQFILGSVVIGNNSDFPACCARLFIGTEVSNETNFLYVGIPPNSHFDHNFSNVVVNSGDTIWFRNGTSVQYLYYTITGELAKAKKNKKDDND
jgi:hypothetical protein